MTLGTLQNFIQIFKDHQQASTELKYFAYGEIFRIEERMQSDIQNFDVPLLWLDEPEIAPNRNGTNLYTNRFQSAIWLITRLPQPTSYEDIEAAYAYAHAQLDAVVAMLYRLHRDRQILSFKVIKEEAISRNLVRTQDLVGWRAEFSIEMQTTTIHHQPQ